MDQLKRCEFGWCESTHEDDTEHLIRHHRHIGQFTAKNASIDVLIRYAERVGQDSVWPHVSLIMETLGESEESTLDLTPREARIWAGQLKVLNGAPWLAEKLTEAADLLSEWEFNEFDDVPHRVTEPRERHTPAAYLIALQAAAKAARETLEGFERLPVATLDALELMRWVGEYRGVVRSMVESVEAIDLDAMDIRINVIDRSAR